MYHQGEREELEPLRQVLLPLELPGESVLDSFQPAIALDPADLPTRLPFSILGLGTQLRMVGEKPLGEPVGFSGDRIIRIA